MTARACVRRFVRRVWCCFGSTSATTDEVLPTSLIHDVCIAASVADAHDTRLEGLMHAVAARAPGLNAWDCLCRSALNAAIESGRADNVARILALCTMYARTSSNSSSGSGGGGGTAHGHCNAPLPPCLREYTSTCPLFTAIRATPRRGDIVRMLIRAGAYVGPRTREHKAHAPGTRSGVHRSGAAAAAPPRLALRSACAPATTPLCEAIVCHNHDAMRALLQATRDDTAPTPFPSFSALPHEARLSVLTLTIDAHNVGALNMLLHVWDGSDAVACRHCSSSGSSSSGDHDGDAQSVFTSSPDAWALGVTLVGHAARRGNVPALRALIRHGARVCLHDKQHHGDTPLHAAIRGRHTAAAACLLEAGARVSLINDAGDTPLMTAARGGDASSVRLLIHHGSDVHYKNLAGDTPLDCALASGCARVVETLMQARERGGTPRVLHPTNARMISL